MTNTQKNVQYPFFIQVTTDLPFTLIVLHTGFVPIHSHLFCLLWSVYNYGLSVNNVILMCFGCIERYFLVFHRFSFQKHLVLFHYGPIVFFVIYPYLLYTGLIVIYSCKNEFDFTEYVCGGPCYQYQVHFIENSKQTISQ